MRQVLIRIPIKPFDWLPEGWPSELPIYGFGMMLFITFLVTTWLASRRATKEGIAPQHLQDLAIWIFVGGLIGARIVYMRQYHEPWSHFFMIWQGGLVFYGSAIGGVVGYVLAYVFVIRKHGLSTWKLADIIAPLVAIGLCLGRVGCFLNGCCYGNVACAHCPAVQFFLSSPARYQLVGNGLQTAAGFTKMEGRNSLAVAAVAPGSPAAESGLKAKDIIVKVEAQIDQEPIGPLEFTAAASQFQSNLRNELFGRRPQADRVPSRVSLTLTVQRDGKAQRLNEFTLPGADDLAKFDFGFTMSDCTVGAVDPQSPAYQHDLRSGDVIVRANDHPINFYRDLDHYLGQGDGWPRGQNDLSLEVTRPEKSQPVSLGTVVPRTLGLHPTQVYESISMALLFLLLTAYFPLRRRDGSVMVLFILAYSVHRFLNEMLRNDTDPVALGMTLSQLGSMFFFAVGLLLLVWVWRRPIQYGAT
jgi:prolipoprotein diacylglyceryltransferase